VDVCITSTGYVSTQKSASDCLKSSITSIGGLDAWQDGRVCETTVTFVQDQKRDYENVKKSKEKRDAWKFDYKPL